MCLLFRYRVLELYLQIDVGIDDVDMVRAGVFEVSKSLSDC
jgi:hypothetical protein